MVIDDVFAVIADETRRDILVSLAAGDKAVGTLVEELHGSQPTVSKHLRVLREAGLVSMRAQGQKRFYSLTPQPLAEVA
nr:winged helix-turn-helix transcriptional regulator [Acidobacteriota bacterium]